MDSLSQHMTTVSLLSHSPSFLALLICVDDVLVTGSHEPDISALKQYLDDLFTIKDLGQAKYFLSLEIARTDQGTYLNQRKYVLDVLQDTGLTSCKAVSTPFPPSLKLSAKEGASFSDQERYRRLIGRLLYLNLTRLDITFVIQQWSQFINDTYTSHWNAELYLLHYLKCSPGRGLFYPSQCSYHLNAYTDSDWAACHDIRKFITGYYIFLGDSLIS